MMQRVHAPEKNSCCPYRQKKSGMFAPRGFARRTEDNEQDAVPQARPLFDSSFAAVSLFPPVQPKLAAARGGMEQEADAASSEEWFDEDAGAAEPVQAKPEPNRTGMPDRLKAGIEALSGIDMSDVRVHANSPKPARLNALAYTQGNQIYMGPGQERHLPHEAWHAVQQKQGRVRATGQMERMKVNEEVNLELEASEMGQRATFSGGGSPSLKMVSGQLTYDEDQMNSKAVQLRKLSEGEIENLVSNQIIQCARLVKCNAEATVNGHEFRVEGRNRNEANTTTIINGTPQVAGVFNELTQPQNTNVSRYNCAEPNALAEIISGARGLFGNHIPHISRLVIEGATTSGRDYVRCGWCSQWAPVGQNAEVITNRDQNGNLIQH